MSSDDVIRARAVLCNPLAQGREAMAEFLVEKTAMTVAEILLALSFAPAGPAPAADDDAEDPY